MRFFNHLRPSILAAALLLLTIPAFAQTLTGKIVGVTDGDTVTLLTADNKQVKIRLNGVDAPETRQPFGAASKQFASKAVFGKQVQAVVKDTDRYGRTVAVILGPDGANLNQALVRNGMAWWYRKYAASDTSLKQLEAEARAAKRGLWAESKTAVAPWDWRKGKRPATPVVAKAKPAGSSARARSRSATAASSYEAPVTGGVYITRTGDKYHRDGCQYLRRSQIPISMKDAQASYSPCSKCF